jgi:hypothetical protein
MLEFLKHLELVIDHLFISLHISFEDYLYGNLASGPISLPDDSVCSSSEGPTKSVLSSRVESIC